MMKNQLQIRNSTAVGIEVFVSGGDIEFVGNSDGLLRIINNLPLR